MINMRLAWSARCVRLQQNKDCHLSGLNDSSPWCKTLLLIPSALHRLSARPYRRREITQARGVLRLRTAAGRFPCDHLHRHVSYIGEEERCSEDIYLWRVYFWTREPPGDSDSNRLTLFLSGSYQVHRAWHKPIYSMRLGIFKNSSNKLTNHSSASATI